MGTQVAQLYLLEMPLLVPDIQHAEGESEDSAHRQTDHEHEINLLRRLYQGLRDCRLSGQSCNL